MGKCSICTWAQWQNGTQQGWGERKGVAAHITVWSALQLSSPLREGCDPTAPQNIPRETFIRLFIHPSVHPFISDNLLTPTVYQVRWMSKDPFPWGVHSPRRRHIQKKITKRNKECYNGSRPTRMYSVILLGGTGGIHGGGDIWTSSWRMEGDFPRGKRQRRMFPLEGEAST